MWSNPLHSKRIFKCVRCYFFQWYCVGSRIITFGDIKVVEESLQLCYNYSLNGYIQIFCSHRIIFVILVCSCQAFLRQKRIRITSLNFIFRSDPSTHKLMHRNYWLHSCSPAIDCFKLANKSGTGPNREKTEVVIQVRSLDHFGRDNVSWRISDFFFANWVRFCCSLASNRSNNSAKLSPLTFLLFSAESTQISPWEF